MALNPKLSIAAANAAANATLALLNDGYLRIYDGAQPASADSPISSQTLLAELRWNAVAFASAVAGVATANAVTAEDAALASGTATWFRALRDDGTSAVFDGTVGTSGANLNLSAVAISMGATVSVSAFTYTQSRT